MLGNCGAREDLFVLLVPSEAFTPPYWDPYFSWLPWWHFILIPTPSPSPHRLPLLSWFLSSVLRLNRGAPQCPKPPSLSRLSPSVSVSTFMALNPTHLPTTSHVWICSPNRPKERKELPPFPLYLDVFNSHFKVTCPQQNLAFQPVSSSLPSLHKSTLFPF